MNIEKLMLVLAKAFPEEILLDFLKQALDEHLLLRTEKTKKMLIMNILMWLTKDQLKEHEDPQKLSKEYDLFKKFKELSNFKNKES